MPTRPKQPKAPAPPKPWRRGDGRYRSADDRFTIEAGGAGRWFLTDAESLDELGLARTLGPYDTLDDTKAAAADLRERAAAASPLAARIAAAKDRPPVPTTSAGSSAPARPRTLVRVPRAAAKDAPEPQPETAPEPGPTPRTWLDELADEDARAATRARRQVDLLVALGVEDAASVVRRDVLGRQPAVAGRLLATTIAAALRQVLDPVALKADARRSIPGEMRTLAGTGRTADADGNGDIDARRDALAAYAAFVAARVLAATLDVVSSEDRAPGAGRDLPGWRLVERPTAAEGDAGTTARRLIVTPEDVAGG